jgi:hypothetical protein
MNGFAKYSEETLHALNAKTHSGLTNHKIQGRLNQYGDNSSRGSKPPCSVLLFLHHFENALPIVAGVFVIYRQKSFSFDNGFSVV